MFVRDISFSFDKESIDFQESECNLLSFFHHYLKSEIVFITYAWLTLPYHNCSVVTQYVYINNDHWTLLHHSFHPQNYLIICLLIMPADKISKKHQCVADGVFYAELDEVLPYFMETLRISSSTVNLLSAVTPESVSVSPPSRLRSSFVLLDLRRSLVKTLVVLTSLLPSSRRGT